MDKPSDALIVIDMQRDFLDPDGYAATAGMDVSTLCHPITHIRTRTVITELEA